jgi:uncharacterized protein
LTNRGKVAEAEHARNLALQRQARDIRRSPLFYLMMTYACQLRCTYCFEHDVRGRFRRENNADVTITPSRIAAAFAAMADIEPDNKACTLYGGEPLLTENKAIVCAVVAEASRRNYRLMAASNGFDLEHYQDLLGPNAIAGLHVPLDGPQTTHDKSRIGTHRTPTFERILANLSDALGSGVRVRVRVNVDRAALDRLDELADRFEQLGFLHSPLFSAYVKAIFATPTSKANHSKTVTDADVAQKLASSAQLAQIFSGYPVIHDRIDSLLAGRPDDAMRSDHCGAPTGQILIFDPAGRIFPCNNVVGQPSHQVGTYDPHLNWNEDARQMWSGRTVGQMRDVQACKYAFFCGGGCLYDAQVRSGSIKVKSCDCDAFPVQFENLVLASYRRIFRKPAISPEQRHAVQH